MQFNDTGANKNGLIQHCETLLDLPLAEISGDTTKLAHFTRLINIGYHKIAILLWNKSGSWEFDDSNNTDFPIASTNMLDSQRDYALPSTALKMYRASVKQTNGEYKRLEYLDEQDFETGLHNETKGFPTHYYLFGDSIWLFPKPSSTEVTLASGLQLWIAREVTEFTTGDTTKVPGFPTPFHHILALYASFVYASVKGLSMVNSLKEMLFGSELPELAEFEEVKNRDEKIVIRAATMTRGSYT